ncbi:MAG: hypothetical protein KF832_27135 [Caldilineaceae bacterium]|nr:hypothetical protein [Caldilineaceae bacterium]
MATRNKEHNRGVVKQPTCPYLRRLDAQQQQAAPIDYPSFENQCQAADETALPLAEQATFCLSGSYRLCDRFINIQLDEPTVYAQPAMPPGHAMPSQETPWQPSPFDEEDWAEPPGRPIWAWASAAVVFVAVLLFGGGVAAYMGWQLVQQGQFLTRTGQGPISTLASSPNAAAQAPTFLIVTATNDQPTPAVPVEEAAPAPTGNPTTNNSVTFPEAVTATPVVVIPPTTDAAQTQAQPVVMAPTDTPVNLILPPPASNATPAPLINVLEEIPTRRPTPTFELPTSTAIPLEPTATATLMILGTPVVIFGPDESAIPPGECTHIRWHVVNVREVYYDNLPAMGDGAKEECIEKEADSYALRVIFADGQTQIFTATVGVLWPSPTPTLTPSFTPELPATPTWTPVPPTATPTPSTIYGVTLRVNGNNRQACSAGTDCKVALLATNMGDATDTLGVEFLQRDSAGAWLCRQDGVCAEQKLLLNSVGPGNTAFIEMRVTLPAESAGSLFTYTLRAVSEGSQGRMISEAVTIEIESQAP